MFEIGSLINAFGGVAWLVFFAIVAISIIVAVHEFGHYIVGRWCGIHAEVFSVGFGPVLLSKTDRHGTLWQVAALPLGGYVKFKGDSNAASVQTGDVTRMARDTMGGAPLWARAATAAAGPVFNFILSAVLFFGLFVTQGQPRASLVVDTVQALPIAHDIRPGDKIVAMEGIDIASPQDMGAALDQIEPAPLLDYVVERDGQRVAARGPYPSTTYIVGVTPTSAAMDAGLQEGDVITAVDGVQVFTLRQVERIVRASEGQPLTLSVWNAGTTRQVTLSPRRTDLPLPEGGFETRWLMGVFAGTFFEPGNDPLPVGRAMKLAVERTVDVMQSSLSGLYHIVTGRISACNLSGPITIAETSGQMAAMGTMTFLSFLAILSTGIGLMNLFPIPMLDGGHLTFYAYEAVSGRPPSERAMRILMSIGVGLVMTLMFFAILTDLICP